MIISNSNNYLNLKIQEKVNYINIREILYIDKNFRLILIGGII